MPFYRYALKTEIKEFIEISPKKSKIFGAKWVEIL